MALGGAVLILEPEILPWFRDHLPHWAMQGIGVALLGVVGAYLVLSRVLPHFTVFGHKIDLPGFRMALMQTTLAVVDVVVTTMIFYVLLPPAEGLTFVRFLGIYLAAYSAGLAANVPGGLGVFDTVILLALQPYVPAPQVIGALFLFRLYYYIVPLFIAGALFAGFEVSQRRHLLGNLGAEARVADRWKARRCPAFPPSWASRCSSSAPCRPMAPGWRNGRVNGRRWPGISRLPSSDRCCW
ncbi:hypothetical protein ACFQU7_11865 [Pseudoroseomonas wenyumeiae]